MQLKIKDFAQIKYGKESKNLEYGSYPVYGSSGIIRHSNSFLYDKDSVLIPRKGSLDNIFFANTPFWATDTMFYTIIDKEQVLPIFFYYAMQQIDLTMLNSGTGVPSLTAETLNDISLDIPKKDMQFKISSVLTKLDKKISINNSIISKLEEMAKTIYEYWFLQFDFPNHEGKPYASSGGAMKYSEELGREIPIDWEAIEIDKICKIYSGFAFKSAQYVKEGKYRLITIKNVQENGVLLEPANFIDELPKKLPAYCLLEQGDILMSLTGNVGRVGLMFDDMCLLNQRVAKICPSNEEMRGLIYFLFKSTFVKSKMENMAGGTSQENLSPIETGKILIPYNKKIFRSFSKVANQWVSMIVKKQRENQKLAQLRDWLLPMLMNGQVRVE